jgi:hypothetical protein
VVIVTGKSDDPVDLRMLMGKSLSIFNNVPKVEYSQ